VVRRLKDDVARGDPPRPISRRHPPQPIVVAPTVREKEIHQRLRGHSKRVLRALRGTDSYHVQAFALEVLRKRALSSPRALLLSLQRRAASLGITLVEHAGRRRLEAMELYRGDVALTDADLDETEELALSGVAHMPDDDLREEQRLVGTLLELAEAVTPADDSKLTRPVASRCGWSARGSAWKDRHRHPARPVMTAPGADRMWFRPAVLVTGRRRHPGLPPSRRTRRPTATRARLRRRPRRRPSSRAVSGQGSGPDAPWAGLGVTRWR
jgi:hypothetical protein